MGSVYLSTTRGGQPVALKVIRREYAENPEFRRRFAREVAAARQVQGTYTAAVIDSNTEGEQPWLASAYVPGPSLADAVQRHGPLPVTSVLTLTAGVAEALQSVHAAGVVHRDLKPSNVLLASDGPRVIDFGIARAGDATALTGTDVRLGTPSYMAPEQAEGRTAGPGIDIFALGLVVFFAATARHPFGEGDGLGLLYRIVSQQPDLTACPEPLRPVVERCLAKDPADRPSLDTVIEDCLRIAEAQGVDLMRGEGWWLPRTVAAEATALELPAPTLPAPPAPAPLPATAPAPHAYVPTQRDGAVHPQPTDTSPARPGETPPAPRRLLRTRRGRLTAVIGAALVVLAGGIFAAVQMNGAGADGPTSSADWAIMDGKQSVAVTLKAPPAKNAPAAWSWRRCAGENGSTLHSTSWLDLRTLEASEHGEDLSSGVPQGFDIRYTNCTDGTGDEVPTNGLTLIEGHGSWGTVDHHDVTGDDCHKAATSKNLPSQVSIGKLQAGQALHANIGICILTKQQTLVLLWIDKAVPRTDNLRDFAMTATEWSSDKG
nr:serine/threonine-protein kinase [Streptomyces sp. ODS25]